MAITSVVQETAVAPQATSSVQPDAEPRSIDSQDVTRLAMCLLDLRAAYETNLQTLTAVQRSLERIRRIDSFPAETDLLLGEMCRHLHKLEDAGAKVKEALKLAGCSLDSVTKSWRGPVEN